MLRRVDVQALVEGVKGGDRAALARSITLVESRKPAHRGLARELLRAITPMAGGSIRLGLSGVPGSGKSTFIDALGCQLIEQGHCNLRWSTQKLAILSSKIGRASCRERV